MAQQYGTVKVDVLTYTSGTDGNETDVSINVSGLGRVSESGITITGNISGDNITASGDLFVSGNATVTGNANVSGLLTVSSITVTGDATVEGNLNVSGNINASGVTISGITGLFASGTAAAPSISFVDDTDTGIYSPGANQVALATNGTGRLFINDSGLVTIASAAINFGTGGTSGFISSNNYYGATS